MSKKQKVVILSYFGENPADGVEKVVRYIRIVLQNNYEVAEMKMKRNIGKLNYILYPILFSFRLNFLNKSAITIAHGWQGFLNASDFVFFSWNVLVSTSMVVVSFSGYSRLGWNLWSLRCL